ncbi:aminopeptidase 1 [Cyclospora cayetanensis]|uniref:Aminopeptidase 1 n=1 Tax=Cyclospora cayetanensis TaxID=88456 RepID=A0A1D3CXW7_9EIME|nr:aminopeptidase 1 [Cyclospora cayetanensis]
MRGIGGLEGYKFDAQRTALIVVLARSTPSSPHDALGNGGQGSLLLELLSSSPPRWRRESPTTDAAAVDRAAELLQWQLPHLDFAEASAPQILLDQKEKEGEEERNGLPLREHHEDHIYASKVFRESYSPPSFLVDSVKLVVKLDFFDTKVLSRLVLHRAPSAPPQDLVLDGEDLELDQVVLNGKLLLSDPIDGFSLRQEEGQLVIPQKLLPRDGDTPFELLIDVSLKPMENRWRKGLFISQHSLITQCEPEGFRAITFFLDRPDILARFYVQLEADMKTFPVLLSNGNKVAEGPIDWSPGKHFVVFDDPHPKPCDYFGIGGRLVTLQFYSKLADVWKLNWALESLKKSMRWDEENFNIEYDLDLLSVVCVEDFGGQMANKGLFIFDCDALLVDPKTNTDADLYKVMSAVAHEYFRNWAGSRVAVRDRFQLSLTEGLTKLRESLFTAAMAAPGDRRVSGVRYIFSKIFRLDQSSRAKPLRPDSYGDVYELYSPALHWKAAEVMRAYQTLLGEDGFRRGLSLYLARHDGEAVTIDDFRKAMEDANGLDLKQFNRWYSQAGTPEVRVEQATYNPNFKTFTLTLSQHTPPTRSQPTKLPLMIPMKFGLIGKISKKDLLDPPTMVLALTSEKKTTVVLDVEEDCVLSVHREFAAPVKFYEPLSEEQRAFLLAYDTDPVNKWRSANVLFVSFILSRAVLARQNPNAVFAPLPALTLMVPKVRDLSRKFRPLDPDALHFARRSVIREVRAALMEELVFLFDEVYTSAPGANCHDREELSRRRLQNALLFYLSETRDSEAAERAYKYFFHAQCMTDKYHALIALSGMEHPLRQKALDRFYMEAKGNQRLVNSWFSVQASADLPDQVERMRQLQQHREFSFSNPSNVRSLLFDFVHTNDVHFHRTDGEGYKLLADAIVELDRLHSLQALNGAKLFFGWRDMDARRQLLMQKQISRLLEDRSLSDGVHHSVHFILHSYLHWLVVSLSVRCMSYFLTLFIRQHVMKGGKNEEECAAVSYACPSAAEALLQRSLRAIYLTAGSIMKQYERQKKQLAWTIQKRKVQVIPDLCRGFVLAEEERDVTTRDCILYALGTAACQDPLDEKDLRYCYEGSSLGFSVLPTFATTFMSVAAIFEGLDKCPGLPDFNPMRLLHGEHKLTLFQPLQADIRVRCRAAIQDVLDKRSGALVAVRVEAFCGGDLLCVNDFQLFIRGIGNFGEGPSSSGASIATFQSPMGAPEKIAEILTQPNLALVYRLSGDYNPLHVDSGLAKMGGFSRPILHGLCTLGIATRHIIKECLDGDPARVASISCRFTAPTTPGDRLRVCMWGVNTSTVVFQVLDLSNKGTVVLRGTLEIKPLTTGNAKL